MLASHAEYQGYGQPDTSNESDYVIGNAEVAAYTVATARMPDGAMLASKVIAIRSSLTDETRGSGGGPGGPGGPRGRRLRRRSDAAVPGVRRRPGVPPIPGAPRGARMELAAGLSCRSGSRPR
jgi:hypothetical protein